MTYNFFKKGKWWKLKWNLLIWLNKRTKITWPVAEEEKVQYYSTDSIEKVEKSKRDLINSLRWMNSMVDNCFSVWWKDILLFSIDTRHIEKYYHCMEERHKQTEQLVHNIMKSAINTQRRFYSKETDITNHR